MSWHAKPSGGYAYNSVEAEDNFREIRNALINQWTIEAICGAIGNMSGESGYNPWRWQSDTVNMKLGYGLVQFTPASGYINDYGVGVENFSPNLSVTGITQGATPEDGYAQCLVLATDKARKWINRASYCNWYDLSSMKNFSAFKECDDLYLATIAFMFNYEGNATVLGKNATLQKNMVDARYNIAKYAYELLTGEEPQPPKPHKKQHKMPIYMMLRRI